MGSLVLMCTKYSLLMYLTLIVCIISAGLVWSLHDACAKKNPVIETSEEKQRAQHECTSVDRDGRRKVASQPPPSRPPVRHATREGFANPTGDDLAGRRISSWPWPVHVPRARTSSPAVRSPPPVVPAGRHAPRLVGPPRRRRRRRTYLPRRDRCEMRSPPHGRPHGGARGRCRMHCRKRYPANAMMSANMGYARAGEQQRLWCGCGCGMAARRPRLSPPAGDHWLPETFLAPGPALRNTYVRGDGTTMPVLGRMNSS
jgi:hypothetical protein